MLSLAANMSSGVPKVVTVLISEGSRSPTRSRSGVATADPSTPAVARPPWYPASSRWVRATLDPFEGRFLVHGGPVEVHEGHGAGR